MFRGCASFTTFSKRRRGAPPRGSLLGCRLHARCEGELSKQGFRVLELLQIGLPLGTLTGTRASGDYKVLVCIPVRGCPEVIWETHVQGGCQKCNAHPDRAAMNNDQPQNKSINGSSS